MSDPAPTVGRIVHYISHGSPVRPDGTQAFTSECRAAIVTAVYPQVMANVGDTDAVSLAVLNPTGLFFHDVCRHDEAHKTGGTWHWPERV